MNANQYEHVKHKSTYVLCQVYTQSTNIFFWLNACYHVIMLTTICYNMLDDNHKGIVRSTGEQGGTPMHAWPQVHDSCMSAHHTVYTPYMRHRQGVNPVSCRFRTWVKKTNHLGSLTTSRRSNWFIACSLQWLAQWWQAPQRVVVVANAKPTIQPQSLGQRPKPRVEDLDPICIHPKISWNSFFRGMYIDKRNAPRINESHVLVHSITAFMLRWKRWKPV